MGEGRGSGGGGACRHTSEETHPCTSSGCWERSAVQCRIFQDGRGERAGALPAPDHRPKLLDHGAVSHLQLVGGVAARHGVDFQADRGRKKRFRVLQGGGNGFFVASLPDPVGQVPAPERRASSGGPYLIFQRQSRDRIVLVYSKQAIISARRLPGSSFPMQ